MKNMRIRGETIKVTEELLALLDQGGMPEKEVKKIVDTQIKKNKLLQKLGLSEWNIDFSYGTCENEGWAAQCAQDPAYKIAAIRIDPRHQEDEEDVKNSLLHELMHIVVSPVESFFMVQLAGLSEDSPEHGRQLEHWRQSNEQLVCSLTKLYTPLLG